ncbi:MAG TPA: PHP domain-containing protein [Candidatus Limnocylindrales bacterium]|nr:PHP domain-containing protein [Candidatus Limnocylindrales bacterium]
MRAELHAHTTASDGQHTPAELVALARALHLDMLAITDHDSTAGIEPAREAARGALTLITGIELSAEDEGGDVHMLGYGILPEDAALQAALAGFRERRVSRAREIVERLNTLGAPVAWERVNTLAAGGSVGRPHVARALIEAGYAESVRDAFDRYLYTGGPAYVARKRLSPEDAIALIHRAGGAAVLAHPGVLPDWRGMVERLLSAGLDGVEVAHPKNDESVRLNLRGLAARYGLIMTGGSDFHGRAVSNAMLGSVAPPPGAVEGLRARAAQWQAERGSEAD